MPERAHLEITTVICDPAAFGARKMPPLDPILETCEFYFSNENLLTDTFLHGLMSDGTVSFTDLLSFPRLKKLVKKRLAAQNATGDGVLDSHGILAQSLSSSTVLDVGDGVVRRAKHRPPPPELPKPGAPLKHLVLDSGALIHGIGEELRTKADEFWTCPEVIGEIRDERSRKALANLPFELRTKEPSEEAMAFIVRFSKLTGDYATLSLVDLKVLALAYMMERQESGTRHLRTEPKHAKRRLPSGSRKVTAKPYTSQATSFPSTEADRTAGADTADAPFEAGAKAALGSSDTPPASSSGGELATNGTSKDDDGDDASNDVVVAAFAAAAADDDGNDDGGGDDDDDNDDASSIEDLGSDEDWHPDATGDVQNGASAQGGAVAGQIDEGSSDEDGKGSPGLFSNAMGQSRVTSIMDSEAPPAAETFALAVESFPSLSEDGVDAPPEGSSVGMQWATKGLSAATIAARGTSGFAWPRARPALETSKVIGSKKTDAPALDVPASASKTDAERERKSHVLGVAAAGVSSAGAAEDDGSGWFSPTNVNVKKATGSDMMGCRRQELGATGELKQGSGVHAAGLGAGLGAGQGGEVAPITARSLGKAAGDKLGNKINRTRAIMVARSACVTTDFAMQSILFQVGLRLLSVDGMVVKRVSQYVLRCNACYLVLPTTEKMFCSRCGSSHLSRVAASVDPKTGEQKLFLKKDYKFRLQGTRYSVPKSSDKHGGRFRGDLVLREDQLMTGIWAQKTAPKAKEKTSMFGAEVNEKTGVSVRKSAHTVVVGFGRTNPNAAKGRERRGKKKKSSGK